MGFQDTADPGVGDQVTKVGQCALDAIVTPARVFAGHAQYEVDNLSRGRRTPDLLAALPVIPLCGHQFPMPAQKRIRSHDRGDLLEHLPPENLTFDRQTAPLVIVETSEVINQENLIFEAFLGRPPRAALLRSRP